MSVTHAQASQRTCLFRHYSLSASSAFGDISESTTKHALNRRPGLTIARLRRIFGCTPRETVCPQSLLTTCRKQARKTARLNIAPENIICGRRMRVPFCLGAVWLVAATKRLMGFTRDPGLPEADGILINRDGTKSLKLRDEAPTGRSSRATCLASWTRSIPPTSTLPVTIWLVLRCRNRNTPTARSRF